MSGDILAREANCCHMMIPMYFDPLRYPASADGEATEDPETGDGAPGRPVVAARAGARRSASTVAPREAPPILSRTSFLRNR